MPRFDGGERRATRLEKRTGYGERLSWDRTERGRGVRLEVSSRAGQRERRDSLCLTTTDLTDVVVLGEAEALKLIAVVLSHPAGPAVLIQSVRNVSPGPLPRTRRPFKGRRTIFSFGGGCWAGVGLVTLGPAPMPPVSTPSAHSSVMNAPPTSSPQRPVLSSDHSTTE